MNRFLICDDHELVREAISSSIADEWPDAVFTETKNFPQSWEEVSKGYDLCICDLSMPGASAIEGVSQLKQSAKDMPILIVTGVDDYDLMLQLLNLGVNGFVQKNSGAKVIIAAIKLIEAGERHVPSRLLALMERKNKIDNCAITRLTDQQRKVLQFVAQGRTNKDIAIQLGVAPSTIKSHLETAMRLLGATSRYEAVNIAKSENLL
ncbi:hypothetical protein LPB140_03320 [Sphingorhabdus lutea]|uniref:Response regulator transcription factor n=2 Tax=Sphingorhabdus lutea TaxID=1913578 RepID=A0A1L3JA51_9SPHN|nr:hypothetical protein LPB140_03320 [Sphingorhabdus lutea]